MKESKTNKPLKEALESFNHIGKCFYNGKHHDNVLNIFNDMDHDHKLSLLRGVFEIFTVVESGVKEFPSSLLTSPPKKEVQTTEDSEPATDASMRELKVWLFKLVALTIVFIMLLAFFAVFFLHISPPEFGSKSASTTFRVFELLLK